VLVEHGADTNIRLPNGKIAADLAWGKERPDVSLILESDAVIEARRDALQANLNSQLLMASQRVGFFAC
jgi:hypothetical protein